MKWGLWNFHKQRSFPGKRRFQDVEVTFVTPRAVISDYIVPNIARHVVIA